MSNSGNNSGNNPQRSLLTPKQQAAISKNKRRYRSLVEKRRLAVWESHCAGVPNYQMAQDHGVTERTIERDIKWWKDRLGYRTDELKDPKNAAIDVGMTAAKLEKVAEDAYVEYMGATNGHLKAKFLMVMNNALVNRHKILADAGYLPKVGQDHEWKEEVKVTFTQRFGKDAPQAVFDDDKKRRRVLEATEAILKESARSGVPVKALLEQAAAKPVEGQVVDADDAA